MDTFTLGASWIFNFIPWWVWVVGVLVAAAITVQFWLPIWTVMPAWMKATLIFIGAVATAFVAGRNRGSKDERDVQRRRDAGAIQKRQEIKHEVNLQSESETAKELKKWNRRDD